MPPSPPKHRFAHLSDVHIGAWREEKLADLSMEAFRWMLDRCVKEKVDFVVISGDLFDSNIPDLHAVKEAAEAMRRLREEGIRIYVTYGSHDYSINATSIIDVLSGAGLFTKVVHIEEGEGRIRLEFVKDEGTGAKLAGLYGRKNGLESEYYSLLDTAPLQEEEGFKVFVFHSAIDELRPADYVYGQSIPLSLFPRGFDYYAGGHVHSTLLKKVEGYGYIAFPGPLFGHGFGDLEEIAQGTKRGFYVVDFSEKVDKVAFVEVPLPEIRLENIDAGGSTPAQVTKELEALAGRAEAKGRILLIRVTGRLASGKAYEIPFDKVRKELEGKGALMVRINRSALVSAETPVGGYRGGNREEIEEGILKAAVRSFSPDPSITDEGTRRAVASKLAGSGGLATAKRLMKALQQESKENERKDEFRTRMARDAKEALRLEA